MIGFERLRLVALLLGLIAASACADPTHPKRGANRNSPLGAYAATSTFCGPGRVPADPVAIPWIGCFSLSAGHNAGGTFANRSVNVAVDASGHETFTVDGIVVHDELEPPQPRSRTNLPFVYTDGSGGYRVCPGYADRCPSDVGVFSRNPDRSVLFMISECLPPDYNACVSTQDNWNYEVSRATSGH